MKAIISVIALSLSVAATASQARDSVPVEAVSRGGVTPGMLSKGSNWGKSARQAIDVVGVMGRAAPLNLNMLDISSSRRITAGSTVATRLGRV